MRILAALAVFFVVLVGPASAAAPPATPPPIDPRLLIIGDSVSLGAEPWILALLGARGWHVYQTSRESLHTWQAPAIVEENRAVGGIGRVVVVQLGTNDSSDPGQLATWMDELMGHLADVPRVYWVNLRQFRETVPAANATIAGEATKWPNLRIIDWDARATPDPSLVYADGYHLNPAGQVAMAELIAETLDGFVNETTAATTTTTVPTTDTSVATSSAHVSRRRSDGGVDAGVLVAIGAGLLVLLGAAAMFATRARRKPDSME